MSRELNQTQPECSEDQRAVRDYFQSDSYQQSHRQREDIPVARLLRARVDEFPWSTGDHWSTASFFLGLAGLNVILLVFATLAPLLVSSLEAVVSRSKGFVWMMAFIQTIMFPPIVSFSFATVTPMFWYGSVLLRFLAGALLVAPGCLWFYLMMTWLEGQPPDDFGRAYAGVMLTQFLVAGTVAIVIQMWSPWTLTHARKSQSPLPPLGMLAMMELTGVAAFGFSVFLWDGFGDIIEGILFFAGMGALSSLAVIASLIALLRDTKRNRASAIFALLASFAMAFLMCSFFAIAEFGWTSISMNLVLIVAVAAYGATVIAGVIWLCIGWLRLCGWRCVNRRSEKTPIAATPPT